MVPFAIEDDDSMLRFAPKALVTQEKTRLCRKGLWGYRYTHQGGRISGQRIPLD